MPLSTTSFAQVLGKVLVLVFFKNYLTTSMLMFDIHRADTGKDRCTIVTGTYLIISCLIWSFTAFQAHQLEEKVQLKASWLYFWLLSSYFPAVLSSHCYGASEPTQRSSSRWISRAADDRRLPQRKRTDTGLLSPATEFNASAIRSEPRSKCRR